jgi:polygalacturonase
MNLRHSLSYHFRISGICLCLSIIISGVLTDASAAQPQKKALPTIDEVGALRLSPDIAPIKAPFAMPVFSMPHFPALSVSITRYGAKENTLATRAIQSAIDEVNSRGGGTVVIPAGQWLTGRITLKSNVNLNLAEGAEVHFSGNVADYRPAVFTRNEGVEVMSLGALIYANGETNIAVTGKGKLVGPPMDCEVRRQVMKSDVVENVIAADKPVNERIYEGYNGGPVFLPMFISPINCKQVYIEGITLERTPFWNIVPVYCQNVIIRGITVNSVGIPRSDGIDIESSRDVLIEYSTLNCGDDCFTMKAGRGEDGLRVNRPTENVVVRYCLAQKGHGGITIGSETASMIRNLYLHDCVFDRTNIGIRFKTRRPRGGGGENLTMERIRMNLADGTAITADMLGSRMFVGELADRLPARAVNRLTPAFRNITIRNIEVDDAAQFVKITGITESPFSNLLVENARVQCNKLIKISDAEGLTFRNVNIQSKDPVINLLDVRRLLFDNVRFELSGQDLITNSQGNNISGIRFVNCTPAQPKSR